MRAGAPAVVGDVRVRAGREYCTDSRDAPLPRRPVNDRVPIVRRRARVGAGGEEQLGRAFLEARARRIPA